MSEKAFEVITGGLQTTVQDLGRPGYLSIGIADRWSAGLL